MMIKSINNFLLTYAALVQSIFVRDRKSLVMIIVVYMFSFLFLGGAFLTMMAILRSVVVDGELGLSVPLDIAVMNYRISVSKITSMAILVFFYLISSLSAYLAEKRWFYTIERIINSIVEERISGDDKFRIREIRMGAISTIRVSGVLLNIMSPALIGLFSFLLLVYIHWGLAIFALGVISIALVFYSVIGKKTKMISLEVGIDSEFDDSDSTAEVSRAHSVSSRLSFISNLLQLKTRSKLVSNLLFMFFVMGILGYLLIIPVDAEALFELAVGFFFIYLCFNGVKVVGSKVVPLSRQYESVKGFLMTDCREIAK